MIRGKMLSGILVLSVAAAGLTLATLNNALGQHGQHQQHQPTARKQEKKDRSCGGMMHGPGEMRQMTCHMANNLEMLKRHLTMMMTDEALRPALAKLLRDDTEFRQMFEDLLDEVGEQEQLINPQRR